ncbi:MAG: RHS repeat protein, partial [Candidatus Omnitrophica bacterium]|nr:RHS repeat protein [Candidatus Omnitrophota bacterium]
MTITDEGFLDETGDERETNITYDYRPAKYIVSKPLSSTVIASEAKQSETIYTYDDNGSLKKEKRWLDKPSPKYIETTYSYYPEGNLHTTTDALGRTTTTTYESTKTFPQSVKNALDHTQSFTYDYATGKITSSTDPNGVTTTSIYDGFGRLKRVEDSEGISYVDYFYSDEVDKNIRPIWVKTVTKVGGGLSDSVSVGYVDGLGRAIKNTIVVDDGQQVASGIVEYDSRGQVIKKYLPFYEAEGTGVTWGTPPQASSPATQYEYDPLGRVVMIIRPDGKVSQNICSITTQETINEKAQRNKVTKDAYGRIVTVEEANGNQMHYEYDILGNLTKVTDCQNNVTTMTYDSLGRKINMNEPNMGRWEYVYNDVGNLETQTDNKQQTITFDYDNINRLISKSTGVTYIYNDNLKSGDSPLPNGIGRLDRVTYPNGEASFEYDRLGREKISTKVIDGVTYTVQREYDSLDRLTKVVYPYGQVVKYKYNKQGGIDLVGADTDEDYFIRETRYDEYGHLEYIEYGNGSKTEYTFDDLTLRLTHLKTWDKNGEVIQDLDYDFDNIGNINSITDSIHASNTQNFGYDTLNRLTHATAGSDGYGSISYGYDDIGNITQKDNLEFIYPNPGSSLPHAVQEVKKNGQTLYNITYDDNGNMLTKGDTTYEWDIENRLKRVSILTGGESVSVDLSLSSGWNFISLPFRQIEIDASYKLIEETTIQEVLQSIEGKYEQVSKYNPQTGKWKHFVNDPGFINNSKFDHSKITNFEFAEGYLIYVNQSCSLTLSGITSTSEQSKQLRAGYNLIGAITDDTISVSDQFSDLNITSAKSYDGSVYVDVSVLEKGKAYWVY